MSTIYLPLPYSAKPENFLKKTRAACIGKGAVGKPGLWNVGEPHTQQGAPVP